MLFLAVFVIGPIIAGGIGDYINSRPTVLIGRTLLDLLVGED